MMDIKEIIKWFIPCFHILQLCDKIKMDAKLTFVFLILLFNLCAPCFGANVSVNRNISSMVAKDSDLVSYKGSDSEVSQSDSDKSSFSALGKWIPRSWSEIGRTFGRPFIKKAVAGLIPLSFQLGAASTWAVVAALLGLKTLLVAGAVLKLLLLAAAAKLGSYFSGKPHHEHHQSWDPQKQIHLHIHNGQQQQYDDHISASPWSRIGDQPVQPSPQPVNMLQALLSSGLTTTTPSNNWLQALQSYIVPTTTTPSPVQVLQALQAYVGQQTTTPAPLNMLQLLAAQPNFLQALQSGVQQNSLVPALQAPEVNNPQGPQTISTPYGTYLKINKRGPLTTE